MVLKPFYFVRVCALVAQLCRILRGPMDCSPSDSATLQIPLSMEFSRREHWSGLLFPTPGVLSDPGIEPTSLESPTLADGFFTTL